MIREARIWQQREAHPESYPPVEGVTGDALAIAWQRIERYIAWRFCEREVVWRVHSIGREWQAPLAPVVAISVSAFEGTPYVPAVGPMGGWMLPRGPLTIVATVGAGPVPEAVAEAVRRYGKFMATSDGMPAGVTRFSSGAFSASVRRDQIDPAKALTQSGAADLLRAYRRV